MILDNHSVPYSCFDRLSMTYFYLSFCSFVFFAAAAFSAASLFFSAAKASRLFKASAHITAQPLFIFSSFKAQLAGMCVLNNAPSSALGQERIHSSQKIQTALL